MLIDRGACVSGPEYVATTRNPLSLVSTEYVYGPRVLPGMLMSPFDRRSSSDTYLPSLASRRRSAFAMAIRSFFTPTVSMVARGDDPPTDADFACCVYKYAPTPTAINTPMNPNARPIFASKRG